MEIITRVERRRRWRTEDKLWIVAEAKAPGAVIVSRLGGAAVRVSPSHHDCDSFVAWTNISAAEISPAWVNACGTLPRAAPDEGSYSLANRPTSSATQVAR